MGKPSNDGELWERRKDLRETARAYDHFCKYRDMVRPLPRSARSIRQLAKEVGINRINLEKLSVKYEWAARVRAYDDYMERRTREENEANTIKMRLSHAKIAQQMVVKATRRLLQIPEESLSARDIVQMIETGVKIERLSRGESTENTRVHGDMNQHHEGTMATTEIPVDLTQLTEEELDDFERICKKIQQPSPDS